MRFECASSISDVQSIRPNFDTCFNSASTAGFLPGELMVLVSLCRQLAISLSGHSTITRIFLTSWSSVFHSSTSLTGNTKIWAQPLTMFSKFYLPESFFSSLCAITRFGIGGSTYQQEHKRWRFRSFARNYQYRNHASSSNDTFFIYYRDLSWYR